MLTERSSVRDKQKKLFLFDSDISSSCDVINQTGDKVFIGSEFNEINTTSAKNFKDLGLRVGEALPETFWHFKP